MPVNTESIIGEAREDLLDRNLANSKNESANHQVTLPSKKEARPVVKTIEDKSVNYTSDNVSVAAKGHSDNDNEKGFASQLSDRISGWKWIAFMSAILLSAFLFSLDTTIVANIQPVLLEFNSVSKITWMSSALLVTATSTSLIWGKIFTQFEAKSTHILCVMLFELGSSICGAAKNVNTMIIGRALCGVGGAGFYVGVVTLIAANTGINERPLYIALASLAWGLGTILGPLVGGASCVTAGGWRWPFYINLITGLLCAPVYIFVIPRWDPRPGVELSKRGRDMDYLGTILILSAFASGVMAISFGGTQYAWSSPEIISMFVCSCVLFTFLGVQQAYCILTDEENRVFPVEFLKSRTMLCLFGCSTLGGGPALIGIYMIPLFFQFTRSDSAVESGVRLLPFIGLLIFGIVVNGYILSVYGLYKPWFAVGSVFSIIGAALMYTVGYTSSVSTVYGYSVILGWGIGLYVQSSFAIAQALVEPNRVSLATGFMVCGQTSGITILLSAANCLSLNRALSSLVVLLPDISRGLIISSVTGAGSTFVKNLDIELRDKVLDALVRANSSTYLIAIVASVITLILGLFMKWERLFIKVI